MQKNNTNTTSALAIFLVAFAVMFIAGLTVVIPSFEEAQAIISIGDQAADVDDDISLTELAVDVVEQALAEIGLVEDAPQQEDEDDDDTDSVSVSSQHDTNVEEQHSTQQRTQEQVDRNENTQGISVSSQHDTNVEEQHSTQQRTQEQVDRNENIQVDVQNQEEQIVTDDGDGTDG
jgi:hypothetical protein